MIHRPTLASSGSVGPQRRSSPSAREPWARLYPPRRLTGAWLVCCTVVSDTTHSATRNVLFICLKRLQKNTSIQVVSRDAKLSVSLIHGWRSASGFCFDRGKKKARLASQRQVFRYTCTVQGFLSLRRVPRQV